MRLSVVSGTMTLHDDALLSPLGSTCSTNPTTGLHMSDCGHLLELLDRLAYVAAPVPLPGTPGTLDATALPAVPPAPALPPEALSTLAAAAARRARIPLTG